MDDNSFVKYNTQKEEEVFLVRQHLKNKQLKPEGGRNSNGISHVGFRLFTGQYSHNQGLKSHTMYNFNISILLLPPFGMGLYIFVLVVILVPYV